ncbi:uncharacterized protein [Henckelia pumila]|uniref:uncharacterized protein n=1 Tax=Henckelia pumila TaxID=405737 RepID=UPI003C6E03A4
MSHSSGSSSSSSNSTIENEVQVEIDEQAYDPGEELMLLVLQHHQKLMEAYEKSNETCWIRSFIQRNHEAGHERLVNDYLSTNPVYHDEIFRRRFRMRRELFLRIVNALDNHSPFFNKGTMLCEEKGCHHYKNAQQRFVNWIMESPPTILTSTYVLVNQLPSGVFSSSANMWLKYLVIALIVCARNEKIVQLFGKVNLQGDMGHQQPCLKRSRLMTCGYDMHSLGLPVHVTILTCYLKSPIFNNVLQGNEPNINFTVNDTAHTKSYYLTDEIYPEWATFVKVFLARRISRGICLRKYKSARKYVEREFEALQSRWVIGRGPARYWYRKKLKQIMLT